MVDLVLWALIVLAGLSFFAFADQHYRGWDDTNQYQLEAQAWHHGGRPPVQELLQNKASQAGPDYVPPFLPYLWSVFYRDVEDHESLQRVKIFQAALMLMALLLTATLLSRRRPLSEVTIILAILFLNEFTRELISIPLSEPLSLVILLASYARPRFAPIGIVIEALVRPPVVLLFGPLIFRELKARPRATIAYGFLTATVMFIKFKSLVKPSAFRGAGLSGAKSAAIVSSFLNDSAFQLFDHFLPYKNLISIAVWSALLLALTATLIWKNRENRSALLFGALYLVVIFIPGPQGVRYFYIMVAYLAIELKPVFTKKLWARLAFGLIALHLAQRQIESIGEFKRFNQPETESAGLVATKKWIEQNTSPHEALLMTRYRYCINFFHRPCFGDALAHGGWLDDMKMKKIKYVIFMNLPWQTEDNSFAQEMRTTLLASGFALKEKTKNFDEVEVIDVRSLR